MLSRGWRLDGEVKRWAAAEGVGIGGPHRWGKTQAWHQAPSAPTCWAQSLTDVNFSSCIFNSGGTRTSHRKLCTVLWSVILGRVLPNLRAAVPPIYKVTAPWTAPHFRVPVISFRPPSEPPNQSTNPSTTTHFGRGMVTWASQGFFANGYTPTARCVVSKCRAVISE